jgi:hypothetical protein
MPVPTVEPKVSIMDLVIAQWTPANVVGDTTPDIHSGWWNPNSNGPQVTFTGDDEAYEGQSGYGAIEGGGGGPVQIVNGVVFANCWAFRNEGTPGPNPKQLVYDMAEEIRRIILANFNGITNLTYISVTSVGDVAPEAGDDPMVFRKAVVIGFNWRTT